jgi:hypothetical protein
MIVSSIKKPELGEVSNPYINMSVDISTKVTRRDIGSNHSSLRALSR